MLGLQSLARFFARIGLLALAVWGLSRNLFDLPNFLADNSLPVAVLLIFLAGIFKCCYLVITEDRKELIVFSITTVMSVALLVAGLTTTS